MYLQIEHLQWMLRILLATLCGCFIGYERTSRNKAAGIRTHAIIALGASLFIVLSKYAFFDTPSADGARVAAQIVSGIGFLGAGVIFVKHDTVQGLTTAAGMWATSGIATCIGAGLIDIGVFTTMVLIILQKIFHCKLFVKMDHPNISIQVNKTEDACKIYEVFEKYHIDINAVMVNNEMNYIVFDTNNRFIHNKNKFVNDLITNTDVQEVSII